MKMVVVGAGYVGLVTAAGFADLGNHVVCVDVDAQRVARLLEGKLPFHEPGLRELVEDGVAARRLSFATGLAGAVAGARAVFVAVGTPGRADGSADLSAVEAVAASVAEVAEDELVLVLKSTVPVGTHARISHIVESATTTIHVASNPEFLREGSAVDDFLRPDRIVVGTAPGDTFSPGVLQQIYAPLDRDADRIQWMDPASAELTKYVANTMLAMRISFMNEVALLCERVGADVQMVRRGVSSDPRIGAHFLYAGPGYGGSCFPKDVRALVATAREHDLPLHLAAGTHEVNERQKGVLLTKLRRALAGKLRGRRIAVWGAAFKPDTDDLRDSPALALIDGLLAAGAAVAVHDPIAGAGLRALFGDRVEVCDDEYEAVTGADALVLVTEWRQYRSPDFERVASLLKQPVVIDGRNIWPGAVLRDQGFRYEGIGVRA
jgi:UDPglucose 6-dehydrogenase